MKNLVLLFFCFSLVNYSSGQNPYWQQQVDYKINVSLNDADHSLDGQLHLEYYNRSNDTLHFIWFHVWPNAYKNDKTAFSEQLLENGRTDYYFSDIEKHGYINRLDFKVNGSTAQIEDHPQHQDIIKVILPQPLAPNNHIAIESPFHVKLPGIFSRSGHMGHSYQVTQWYPKPAVYDSKGWHEMPYLDQGEFYSEFGNYDVSISLPGKYIVAATGVLTAESMDGGIKTLHYIQKDVHDFAWFADSAFIVKHDTLKLNTKIIDVYAYYYSADSTKWKNSIGYIKDAISTKSDWIGEYPYPVVSVVESVAKGSGGMEYPTITLVSPPVNEKLLDYVINHEVGHNWFYGILATNERLYPWMDEGMNSFYDRRYSDQKYVRPLPDYLNTSSRFIKNRIPDDPESLLLQTLIRLHLDQPIETASQKFSLSNYNLVAYSKAAQWMQKLEEDISAPVFDQLMKEYFRRWQFKHPYPEDFKNLAQEISGKELDTLFDLLKSKGSIQRSIKKNLSSRFAFSFKDTDKHHYIFIMPAIGFNNYDKFMIGALFHNYTLPGSKFQFVAAPLYATGSKEFNGTGRASYELYSGNNGHKLELALGVSKFSADSFTDSTGRINYLTFNKIAPSLKFVFANKNPRSPVKKYIQWKTFFISETALKFSRDTIRNLDIISYPIEKRYVNQLQLVIENNRVLYPYKGALQAEQGKGFMRINFTGNYFFNYPKGGGLDVRLFAGKFIYTGDQTFITKYETDRYQLNMTGPKGYEDYTYQNYFIGRNDFAYSTYQSQLSLAKNIVRGAPTQQIMERDGFFKIRTDLLSNKIGKSDDWLAAINFSSTIPAKINPLELLPVKLPIKIFVDAGTYAEAWKNNSSTGRFIFDAGFQLSLFKNVVNIYLPVLYSKVYKDYVKSTLPEKKFLKNISFSIDFQHASLKKLFPLSPF